MFGLFESIRRATGRGFRNQAAIDPFQFRSNTWPIKAPHHEALHIGTKLPRQCWVVENS